MCLRGRKVEEGKGKGDGGDEDYRNTAYEL
jgi:hypothetical protein